MMAKTVVSDGENGDVPSDMNSSTLNILDSIIWSAESDSQEHNDLDLDLIKFSETIKHIRNIGFSVFGRVNVNGHIQPNQ